MKENFKYVTIVSNGIHDMIADVAFFNVEDEVIVSLVEDGASDVVRIHFYDPERKRFTVTLPGLREGHFDTLNDLNRVLALRGYELEWNDDGITLERVEGGNVVVIDEWVDGKLMSRTYVLYKSAGPGGFW